MFGLDDWRIVSKLFDLLKLLLLVTSFEIENKKKKREIGNKLLLSFRLGL